MIDHARGGGDSAAGARAAEHDVRAPAPSGLDDPRALDILTTEHWSLLSARTLGYQEMFGRATIFVGVLSGTVVALALLAQATSFGPETLAFALLLIVVALFIGITTFLRCAVINLEDARWVAGMDLVRRGYLQIVPEVEPFLLVARTPNPVQGALAHGAPQHAANLGNSLTTTSSVVATLNSVLAGALASGVATLLGAAVGLAATIGAMLSVVSAGLHVWYGARFRRRHAASMAPRASG
jgi:prepilin signal peptidase PulO-like enzyme (type II secretory pathway)